MEGQKRSRATGKVKLNAIILHFCSYRVELKTVPCSVVYSLHKLAKNNIFIIF